MSRPQHNIVTDFADLRSLGRRYRVRVLRYRKGAEPIAEDQAGSYGAINAALAEANRLQSVADARAEPVQAFVIDDHGVPVARAGGRP